MVTAYRGLYIRIVATPLPTSVPIRPAATIVLVLPGDPGFDEALA